MIFYWNEVDVKGSYREVFFTNKTSGGSKVAVYTIFNVKKKINKFENENAIDVFPKFLIFQQNNSAHIRRQC